MRRPGWRRAAWAALLAAAAGVAGCAAPPGRGAGPAPLAVLAFWEAEPGAPAGPPVALERRRGLVDTLIPALYTVREDGSLAERAGPEATGALKSFARRNGIRVRPLFANQEGNGAFLLNAAARSRAARNVADAVAREGFDGAVLDFRLSDPATRGVLTEFVTELTALLPHGRKDLLVAAYPSDPAGEGPYDLAALSGRSERILLMSLDRHRGSTAPGPVAPLEWVETLVRRAVRETGDPGRLVLVLAAHGYDWPVGAVGPAAAEPPAREGAAALAARAGRERVRLLRDRDGSPNYAYAVGGVRHQVWFEDGRSILGKLRLAKRMRLGGVAVLRAGDADEAYWESLAENR